MQTEHTCDSCKYGEWRRKGWDVTMMDDECGGCTDSNDKWELKESNTPIDNIFTFVSLTEEKQSKVDLARKSFEDLGKLMGQLCYDTSTSRFNNGLTRLLEAKFWFIEAICKD